MFIIFINKFFQDIEKITYAPEELCGYPTVIITFVLVAFNNLERPLPPMIEAPEEILTV